MRTAKQLARSRPGTRAGLALSSIVTLVVACSGTINEGAPSGGAAPPEAGDDRSGAPSGGDVATPRIDQPLQSLACDRATEGLGPAPLRRLTRAEYRNTVQDLFRGLPLPALDLPQDAEVDGFDNNERTQTAIPVLVERYHGNAQQVGAAVEQNVEAVAPCAGEVGCAASVVERLGRRVFRRPLASEELTRHVEFVEQFADKYGFARALGMWVEAILQSAHFIYRPEFGVPDPERPDDRRLDGYELATRLSFFLWQAAPDDALLDAAARGELDTAAGVEAEARRLLADDRARAALRHFQDQWLELDRIKTMARDAELFPEFDEAVPPLMHEATARFVEHQFWEGDATVASLLLTPEAWVNDKLAPFYGVSAPGSEELTRVTLPTQERAGLLTQPGLMAGMAHEKFDAPILRGVFVLDRFLCAPPPAPPPNVPDIVSANDDGSPKTTRQQVEELHVTSTCRSCHAAIDNAGFGFNHYDAVGRYRTTDNGLPVDASGHLENVGDASGTFVGAIELSQRLAQSEHVEGCVARHFYRFALGHTETNGEACAIVDSMTAAQGNLRELLIQIVLSDNFRYRRPVVVEG